MFAVADRGESVLSAAHSVNFGHADAVGVLSWVLMIGGLVVVGLMLAWMHRD